MVYIVESIYGGHYYVTYNKVYFDIVRWDREKIIAFGEGGCFSATLTIDLNQESVYISSITNENYAICKEIEGIGGYKTNAKLVDGSGKYIDIGKSKMIWKEKEKH